MPRSAKKVKAISRDAAIILLIIVIFVGTIAGVILSVHEGVLQKSIATIGRVGNGVIGYMVPLYSYPNPPTRYDNLIQLKEKFPNVPIGVILNLHNGPGLTPDPIIARYIDKFRMTGILVLGYVYTGSTPGSTPGLRDLAGSDSINGAADYGRGVEQSITTWASFYDLSGIYLDNGPSGDANSPAMGYPGHTILEYYEGATRYAKDNFGYDLVFGNPGGIPGQNYSKSFVGSVDVINSIESPQLDSPTQVEYSTTRNGGNSSQWSMIAYDNPNAPSVDYLRSISEYVGWIYVSDASSGINYQIEPTYQISTVENLAILDDSNNTITTVVPTYKPV